MNSIENHTESPIKGYLLKSLIMLLTCAAIIYLVVTAEHIHSPYLAAVVGAMALGFVEPRKGWILAIAQCIIVVVAYFLFTNVPPENSARRELESFALFGSLLLIFIASFLGGFIKRALDS